MQTFIQWAGKNKKELPVYVQDESGSTKRAGIASWAYPDAYVRQAYPDSYFMPYAADAAYKMGLGAGKTHTVDRKAPPDNAF